MVIAGRGDQLSPLTSRDRELSDYSDTFLQRLRKIASSDLKTLKNWAVIYYEL